MDLDAQMKTLLAHMGRAAPLLERLEAFLSNGAKGAAQAASIDELRQALAEVGTFRDQVEALIPEIRKTASDVQIVAADVLMLRAQLAPIIAAFEHRQAAAARPSADGDGTTHEVGTVDGSQAAAAEDAPAAAPAA